MTSRRVVRRGVVGVGLGLLALTACAPRFPDGATLTFDRRANEITVSWPHADEPDDGQYVSSYRVSIDGGPMISVHPLRNGCNLVGLAAGTHSVSVAAENNAGEVSTPVTASVEVLPPGLPGPSGPNCQAAPEAPGAPTGVGAQAIGDGRVTVTWTAPNFQGSPGLPIEYYRIRPYRAGVVQAEVWAAADEPLPVTVDGLDVGESYTFTVEALNYLGLGPASAPSEAIVVS